MLVRDVMQRDPAVCAPDATLDQVGKLMAERDCRIITIINLAEQPVGIVTDRDIIRRVVAEGRNPAAYPIQLCMSRPVLTVASDAPIDRVGAVMQTHRIRRVPVVDDHGRCVGIVSDAEVQGSHRPS